MLKEPRRAIEGESEMSCPKCSAADLTEINLNLRGRSVVMHSCSRCEMRWWDAEGEQVALRHVLGLATPD